MICLHYKNHGKFHLVYVVCKGWTDTEVWVISEFYSAKP